MLHRFEIEQYWKWLFLCTVCDGNVKIMHRVLDFAHIRHMKQSDELDRVA